jgi:hypothetical protein
VTNGEIGTRLQADHDSPLSLMAQRAESLMPQAPGGDVKTHCATANGALLAQNEGRASAAHLITGPVILTDCFAASTSS